MSEFADVIGAGFADADFAMAWYDVHACSRSCDNQSLESAAAGIRNGDVLTGCAE